MKPVAPAPPEHAPGMPVAPTPELSSFDLHDGNFKKGAIRPATVLVGLGVLVAVGVGAVLAIKSSGEKMTVDQINLERKTIYQLPKNDQLPKWRAWAEKPDVPVLQQEAFAELAWAKDPAGLDLIVKGLQSDDHRVRGVAALAIAEYGSPAADSAKAPLNKALSEATGGDKPQLSWALAALHDGTAFDTILEEYKKGDYSTLQRLDGSPAFDPETMVSGITLEKLASLSGDTNSSVRMLVAQNLARTGDPKWTDLLIKAVKDPSIEVARQAAVGLGKIGNEAAMTPLLGALDKADKDSRKSFLEALRDGVGARGVLLAMKSVNHKDVELEKFQTKQIFEMVRDIEDPRGADLLVQYIDTDPPPHWKTEAALRLAEVGDVRAAPTLGWRLKQDTTKLYNKDNFPELSRDDNERVVSARMLADLAVLHPEASAQLLAGAEEGTMFWATEYPQPHANALRFLAYAGSKPGLARIKKWADPPLPLPKAGEQKFADDWATAQSALRYLGVAKDPSNYPILAKQLDRRPSNADVTTDGMQGGGIAVLGMTVRALSFGAADGFAQWGEPKSYAPLMKLVEDKENNEQARLEACFALAWVASDDQMKEVVKKVHDFGKPDPREQIIRKCYLETVIRHPVPAATAGLADLLAPAADLDVRHQAARAIGFGGIDNILEAQLITKLADQGIKTDVALALLLGGTPDAAARAVASYNDAPPEALDELKKAYVDSFGVWTDRNYEHGDLARWIANAEAASHVRVKEDLQDWAKTLLAKSLQGIEFDNGPHSMTRVQLRYRLLQDAKGGDDKKRVASIESLKFLREKGALMALRAEPPPTGPLAKAAFFDVMNPKIAVEVSPGKPAESAKP